MSMQSADLVRLPDDDKLPAPRLADATYPAQPGSRTSYIGLTDAFRIVRRRRWLILLVVAVGLLLTLAFLVRTPPMFTSTTLVMVQVPGQQVSPDSAPMATPSPNEEALIQTKVELLQSRALARQMVASLQLGNDPEFAPKAGQSGLISKVLRRLQSGPSVSVSPALRAQMKARDRNEGVVDNLLNRISVNRVARSNVISIAVASTDPVKAARIANRLVEIFIRNQIADMREGAQRDLATLSQQIADAQQALQDADMQAASYRRQHGLTSARPEESGTLQTNNLVQLLAEAQAENASDRRKSTSRTASAGGDAESSGLLSGLRQQEAMLAGRLGELSGFYGPGYPEVAKTTADLAAVRKQIGQEAARVVADRRTQASASGARSAILSARIADLRARSLSDSSAAVPLKGLERKIEATATLYATLLHQLHDKKSALQDIEPDISRVSRGPIPDAPSYPLPKRVLPIALGASAMLGVMLAFMIEAMDTKLRTAEQVRRLLGLPVLAMVPKAFSPRDPMSSLVADKPQSRFAEAMRNLLIEVEDRTDGEGGRIVAVTSPLEGEGKSTIATSLAAAAEAIGRHAVVVDLDLRREPSYGLRDTGVVAYLSNRAGVEDLLAPATQGQFTMIGVGEAAADPGALVASPRLVELLQQLRGRYQMIVVNAPPILPVRDAKTLAKHVDATLLVLRWGRTTPEAAIAAMEVFGQPVIGAVLNQVDYERHARRRYGDTIHYASQSYAYHHPEPQFGNFSAIHRVKRSLRRMGGSVAEALHLG